MKLEAITTHNPATVGPDAVLSEAARKMENLNIGFLPVCDGSRLVGVLTDRDIIVRAIAKGSDPKKTKVSEIMSRTVVSCHEDQELSDAVQLMEYHQVRRLPVLGANNRLVGIVSLGDIAVRSQDLPLAGQALERISEPSSVMVL